MATLVDARKQIPQPLSTGNSPTRPDFRSSRWLQSLFGGLLLGVVGCGSATSDPATSETQAPSAPAAVAETPAKRGVDYDWGAENASLGSIDEITPASYNEALAVQSASQAQPSHQPVANLSSLSRQSSTAGQGQQRPVSGSPEWDIHQIAAILTEIERQTRQTPEKTSAAYLEEQHRRIIALASHAVAETHSRPEKELIFNAAVHSLIDTRLKLALNGDKESIDALYSDAQTLIEKHRGSSAASTAHSGIIQLAEGMASQGDRNSPWISEYVRQSKLFAVNFPAEEARAIMQLMTAAEFCEQRQLTLPAMECYTFIQQNFPESPFTSRSEAALERLKLVGKTLPIEGPDLQGKTVRLADLQGSPVLIAFWSSKSAAFEQDLPVIQELCRDSNCQLLGINMDTDVESAQQFVAETQLPGQHLFYPEATLQGASQPLARQFGIHTVPSYWLLDKQGKILSTSVSQQQLGRLKKETDEK